MGGFFNFKFGKTEKKKIKNTKRNASDLSVLDWHQQVVLVKEQEGKKKKKNRKENFFSTRRSIYKVCNIIDDARWMERK